MNVQLLWEKYFCSYIGSDIATCNSLTKRFVNEDVHFVHIEKTIKQSHYFFNAIRLLQL